MHKVTVVPVLVAALCTAPAYAIDQEQVGREPTTNEVLADALIARPLGLVGTVIGAVHPAEPVDRPGRRCPGHQTRTLHLHAPHRSDGRVRSVAAVVQAQVPRR